MQFSRRGTCGNGTAGPTAADKHKHEHKRVHNCCADLHGHIVARKCNVAAPLRPQVAERAARHLRGCGQVPGRSAAGESRLGCRAMLATALTC